MTREVVIYPDRRLKSPAVPIGEVGPAARRLAKQLEQTARAYPHTVGLAAPQIGLMWRMIFVDCTGHKKVPDPRSPRILINPRVTASDGGEVGREGCLSLPDITANVRRAIRIEVAGRDLDGRAVRVEIEGFEARVVLHEIDHLDGVLILDRVASLATDVFPRKIRTATAAAPAPSTATR
jgi:peptide deformylase